MVNPPLTSNVAQQKRSFGMPGKRKYHSENFWAQAMRPIGREGAVGLHRAGEV